MKPNLYPTRIFILLNTALLLLVTTAGGQICTSPQDTVMALNTKGVIYPVSVNDANAGTNLPPLNTTDTAINSNGMGYNQLNGKFYYFHRSGATTGVDREFVSYDYATGTLQVLANFPSTAKIRSGCVNNSGAGYYTIDPTAPTLYYYDIAGDSWTALNSSFVDTLGATITNFSALNSGDMAFDGQGNLWVLCAKSTSYALYKIPAPVPTTPVASITAIEVIPATPPPGGKSITGLAFNADGSLFLSTGTGDNKLYRMDNASSPLTLVGTFPIDDIGADLTSCSYPLFVLPARWLHFSAVAHNNVQLSWTVMEDDGTAGYKVETSSNGANWKEQAFVARNNTGGNAYASYHYNNPKTGSGTFYYRITQIASSGTKSYSPVKLISTGTPGKIVIGPNPAGNVIYVYGNNAAVKYMAQVYDVNGRLVLSEVMNPGQQTISIDGLQNGTYVLRLNAAIDNRAMSYRFVKK